MTATYEAIATTTSSASTTITFDNVPQTFTDIVLIISGANSGNMVKRLNFNNDTGNGSSLVLSSPYSGSTPFSATYAFANIGIYGSGTNTYHTIVHIMNYSNSTTFKTYLYKEANAAESIEVGVGMWRSTSAITKIQITSTANNFGSTTFTLYGIKASA